MQLLRPAALLLVAACAGIAADPKTDGSDVIHRAFLRLYNFDFPGTHAILDRRLSEDPSDSLAYGVRASAYLFSELDRLGILEAEFLGDDDRIIDKKKGKPDPNVKKALMDALEKARQSAYARLARQPRDPEALFTLCVASGVETDYAALVEKRQWGSLSYAKQSQKYAARLLSQDPTYYDAYLTSGVSEYLLGSLPFFLRWFIHFDQVQGSKQKAIENLELVGRSGRYLKPFAKILLAIIYMREKQPRKSEAMLRDYLREYPENPLVRHELALIDARRR
ncbi:MAG: hypothetical protein ABSE56_22405 [Bryobacteraceae bacterium]